MPEGDTILRAAQALHRALSGHVVTRFESVYPALTRVADDQPDRRPDHRIGLRARQAPADGVFRRPGAAHAHADERELAPLPVRGCAGSAPHATCGCWSATADAVAVGFNVPVAELLSSRQLDAHRRPARARTRSAGRRGRELRVRRRCRRDRPPHARPRTRPRSPRCCSTSVWSPASATCSSPRSSSWRASIRSRPRLAQRRRPRAHRRHRARSAARRACSIVEDAEPIDRPPHDAKPRSERGAVGLQPRGQAVPALRDDHPIEEDRAGREAHVLVSGVPEVGNR